jgi:uncharacterized glyoxalase superfamily protein PhnB
VLGWSITRQWGGKNGEARGVILSGGGIKVVITEQDKASAKVQDADVFLDIHDIDTRFRSLPKGDYVVKKPEATRWGTRWFVLRDPDGNVIAFEEVHRRGGNT